MECTERNFITRVWTFYHSLSDHDLISHVKLTQSTALEQKHFDLRSLSPALRNLWLLLVIIITITNGLLSQFIFVNRPVSLRFKINFQFFALKIKEK